MSLNWKWQSDDENIKYYRYQLGGEDDNGWTVVDGKTTSVTIDSDTLITDFYLQASYDGAIWSSSSKMTYYPTNVKKERGDIGDITLSWENEGDYNYFRYQRDGEEEGRWTVTDGKTESAVLPYHKGLNTYYIQSSWDGLLWSDSAVTTYTYEKEPVVIPLSLRLNVAPYSSAVYYFYEGHYIDKARTLMGTIYGVSTLIEFDWTPFNFLRIYPEFGYAYEMKMQTVIPKKQDMQYIKLGGGFDGLVGVSERSDVYLGAFGGVMWHINNNKYNIAPYFGGRVGFETALGEHFTLGAFTRVTASFLKVEDDKLYSSVTLLIDPVSLTFAYNF